MKLAVFADRERQACIAEVMSRTDMRKLYALCRYYGDYDEFICKLPRQEWDAVLIAHKGALGMQAVRAAKILLHRIPIAWLSDDAAFVEESYRLGCTYFSADPITENLLSATLDRCKHERRTNQ